MYIYIYRILYIIHIRICTYIHIHIYIYTFTQVQDYLEKLCSNRLNLNAIQMPINKDTIKKIHIIEHIHKN